MSSQAIDNQIQNSIRRVITEVRERATQEGKKQISAAMAPKINKK